jgi:hypothetical protein
MSNLLEDLALLSMRQRVCRGLWIGHIIPNRTSLHISEHAEDRRNAFSLMDAGSRIE